MLNVLSNKYNILINVMSVVKNVLRLIYLKKIKLRELTDVPWIFLKLCAPADWIR